MGTIILAWALAIIGAAFAYILLLANGMKTAPARWLSLPEMGFALALPVTACVVAGMGLWRTIGAHSPGLWWRATLLVIPILIVLPMMLLVVSPQTGGRRRNKIPPEFELPADGAAATREVREDEASP